MEMVFHQKLLPCPDSQSEMMHLVTSGSLCICSWISNGLNFGLVGRDHRRTDLWNELQMDGASVSETTWSEVTG